MLQLLDQQEVAKTMVTEVMSAVTTGIDMRFSAIVRHLLLLCAIAILHSALDALQRATGPAVLSRRRAPAGWHFALV